MREFLQMFVGFAFAGLFLFAANLVVRWALAGFSWQRMWEKIRAEADQAEAEEGD